MTRRQIAGVQGHDAGGCIAPLRWTETASLTQNRQHPAETDRRCKAPQHPVTFAPKRSTPTSWSHRFETPIDTGALVLHVEATWGAPAALFSVRCYGA
jgi:hypothetical protein